MSEKKLVFILTSSYDRPDVSAGAMQLAANMKAFDAEICFFLMDKAALLAKKGFAETITWQASDQFSPLHELIKTLSEDLEVKFYICAVCMKHHDMEGAELIEGAEVKPGSFLGQMLMEREGLTF
ncbi:MAG: DsrE family protein [Thermodesulfovibrionales bacterium]|nr:DsrE family protein [Thermodesulfovibrionales bacterium]